jgi:hypothetical protein
MNSAQPNFQENRMQLLITAVTVLAGMALSLGIALAAEELIFGKVLRLFLVRQAVQVKPVLIKHGQPR